MKCSSHRYGQHSRPWRTPALAILLGVLPAIFPASARTQDTAPTAPEPSGNTFTITEAVVAGGGVAYSQSPCYELAGTVAQAVAGPVSGDTFDLYAGYWNSASSIDTIFRNGFEACQP